MAGLLPALLATTCFGFFALAATCEPSKLDVNTSQICVAKADDRARVVWKTEIGSSSSTPVVVGGRVYVGTNNAFPRDANIKDDRGVLMCFSGKNGEFQWQRSHPRLAHRANDSPNLGLGRPSIDEGKVYYQSNRGELLCYDLADSKLLWKVDYVADLHVFRRDAGDGGNPLPTPLVVGDLVYCATGNGSTFGYPRDFASLPFVPQPDAPSLLAVNKRTGKVVWSSSEPGKRIAYAQWGSPSQAQVDGKSWIIFPGGDGCLYMFEPLKGKLIGKVNCNLGKPLAWGPAKRGGSVFFLSKPTVVEHMAYVGLNQDLETPQDVRCPVVAVDLKRLSEGQAEAIRWSFTDKAFDGVVGPVAVGKYSVYAMSRSGVLVALDRTTGKELWRKGFEGVSRFGGPVVKNDKLYVPGSDNLYVLTTDREPKVIGRYEFDHLLMGAPAFDGPNLFVATSRNLWCLREHD